MVSSLFHSPVVFTETAAQYEARISVLQSQPVEWRRASGQNMVSVCLFPQIVSKSSALNPSVCSSLPVRSVEEKAGWTQTSPVMNPQWRSPTARQRPTGGTTNRRSLRRQRRRREKGRRLQQKGIFHCGTAIRPRCPPSP